MEKLRREMFYECSLERVFTQLARLEISRWGGWSTARIGWRRGPSPKRLPGLQPSPWPGHVALPVSYHEALPPCRFHRVLETATSPVSLSSLKLNALIVRRGCLRAPRERRVKSSRPIIIDLTVIGQLFLVILNVLRG